MGSHTVRTAALLDGARRGSADALARLMPLVYAELRQVAGRLMARERPGHTLQPTALVNEAFVRLFEDESLGWENRAHFFGIASRAMRQVLVDRARARAAAKRGGGRVRVTLDSRLPVGEPAVELQALDDALTRLAAVDPELERLVDLRYFGGLSIEEAARVLDVSPATVKRRWALARAWLAREMGFGGAL
jgi:RNA polymerase sigma factor (TIGR02999 family)